MGAPDGWLTLGGDASLRRALSHDGNQASWQPEGLVESIAALEVRADGEEQALRLCALGSLLGPSAPPEGSDGDETRAWAEQFLALVELFSLDMQTAALPADGEWLGAWARSEASSGVHIFVLLGREGDGKLYGTVAVQAVEAGDEDEYDGDRGFLVSDFAVRAGWHDKHIGSGVMNAVAAAAASCGARWLAASASWLNVSWYLHTGWQLTSTPERDFYEGVTAQLGGTALPPPLLLAHFVATRAKATEAEVNLRRVWLPNALGELRNSVQALPTADQPSEELQVKWALCLHALAKEEAKHARMQVVEVEVVQAEEVELEEEEEGEGRRKRPRPHGRSRARGGNGGGNGGGSGGRSDGGNGGGGGANTYPNPNPDPDPDPLTLTLTLTLITLTPTPTPAPTLTNPYPYPYPNQVAAAVRLTAATTTTP